jgi:WASH complex subunit strumpellin
MEKITFITRKVGFEELNYDEDIPMPSGTDPNCNNFMGRLLIEILNLTEFRKCIFLSSTYAFYDLTTGREVFTLKTLSMLYRCIGISGLQGLDHLLGVLIMTNLSTIIRQIDK